MNEQVKVNMSFGFYTFLTGTLVTLASLIFCIINEIEKSDLNPIILIPTILAVVIGAGIGLLSKQKRYQMWFSNAIILNSILIAFAFIMYISTRTSYIQGVMVALEVLTPAFVGTMICYAVALIITIASSFMKQIKE